MATPSAAQHRDLEQRFRNIESAVKALAAAVARRPKFEVSAGDLTIRGGDLVVDGGDFLLLDTDGSTVFRLGPQEYGDRGVSVYRETGELAIGVRKAFGSGVDQTVEVRDRFGSLIVGEESLGDGLARPFLHLPFHPVLSTPAVLPHGPFGPQVPLSATSWTTTHQAWFARHNQYAQLALQVSASDALTACEVRVVDVATGDALGGFLSGAWTGVRAAGSTAHVEVESPPLFLPGMPDDRVSVAVQVRRTAGTGTLDVALPESHGG